MVAQVFPRCSSTFLQRLIIRLWLLLEHGVKRRYSFLMLMHLIVGFILYYCFFILVVVLMQMYENREERLKSEFRSPRNFSKTLDKSVVLIKMWAGKAVSENFRAAQRFRRIESWPRFILKNNSSFCFVI